MFVLVVLSFVPLLAWALVGCNMQSPKTRHHQRAPWVRSFQQLDVYFQLLGWRRGGPIATAFISGTLHSLPVFALGLAMPSTMVFNAGYVVVLMFTLIQGLFLAWKWQPGRDDGAPKFAAFARERAPLDTLGKH